MTQRSSRARLPPRPRRHVNPADPRSTPNPLPRKNLTLKCRSSPVIRLVRWRRGSGVEFIPARPDTWRLIPLRVFLVAGTWLFPQRSDLRLADRFQALADIVPADRQHGF